MWWVSHPGVEDAYEHADHEYREERIEWVGANGAERATQPSEQSHSKGDSLLYTNTYVPYLQVQVHRTLCHRVLSS